ncbi:MAG: 2-oxoglutarate dehydrogenase E1 component [Salinivirgaceae bacterium]|nr:2-oxoglutarate dehydrogenase E1 component [Salinivirgaceae bacterium]
MNESTFLGNIDPQSIEYQYDKYKKDPQSVEATWRWFFEGFEFSKTDFTITKTATELSTGFSADKEFNVVNLIEDYRSRGHLFTNTNPVRQRRKYRPTLDIGNFGLQDSDLDTQFEASKLLGLPKTSLQHIVDHLQQTYCQSVGVEYKFIRNPDTIKWIEKRIEGQKSRRHFTDDEKMHIYKHLNQAVSFEQFIVRNFPGQKSFSLEGCEGLIPAMDQIIEYGSTKGIDQFIIGMAHRGRLNVLSNIMKKPYREIFRAFTATEFTEGLNVGDVKYHLGYDNKIATDAKKEAEVHLLPNPSHLETVSPIAQGVAKAKINNQYEGNFTKVIPIVIHGDAAIAAQGIVYETIQMSQLEGYTTGGTIHMVINNQVGFTTNYIDARSSTYSTDIAKVIQSPIFHVNGDDVEALIYVIELAIDYRQKWNRDVFIDVLGYRKHGHNEGDEPRFTQPALYKTIAAHPNPAKIYEQKLISEKSDFTTFIDAEKERFDAYLESEFQISKEHSKVTILPFLSDTWSGYKFPDQVSVLKEVDTSFNKDKLIALAQKVNSFDDSTLLFQKTAKILNDRIALIDKGVVDWALGEQLAYASLLSEGFGVRLSGQDSVRGTFSHRHSAILLEENERKIIPIRDMLGFEKFSVYNSLLSEYGVMGFEYGHAMATPETLTIWEAQFGDFHNVAQVIIDQYISTAGEKWGTMNGLTLYLPHGYEGQGAEHSSARIERFLTLAADENMTIANCTTPANMYHLLRRQMLRNFRVPLILFTPKSLLRHPKVQSSLEELATGKFEPVIDDLNTSKEVTRVVFCSGKIYYDLLQEKENLDATDVALVRIEELYPFPKERVDAIISKYKKALVWIWAQEEPINMGAWSFVRDLINIPELQVVARRRTATTAVGLTAIHKVEQQEIIQKVFKPCTCDRNLKYCGLQCVSGKERVKILRQREYLLELDNVRKSELI